MSGIQSTQPSSPLLSPPSTNGLDTGCSYYTGGNQILYGQASLGTANTPSATVIDAVNYTGAGVLEFCAKVNGTGTNTLIIIIDGVTVFSKTDTNTNFWACPVGALGSTEVGGTQYFLPVLSVVPFYRSLQIQHGGSGGATYFKYRKTA